MMSKNLRVIVFFYKLKTFMKDIVKMTFKDKHRQQIEQFEFSRTSAQWIIHPKYSPSTGNNFDLCLVKLQSSLDLITGKMS